MELLTLIVKLIKATEEMPNQKVLEMVIYMMIFLPTKSNYDSEGLHEVATITRADHEIYSSQMLTKKRGYPLWVPGPGRQLPIEYRREGITIGDVGIITPLGAFDFLFNIFQSANDPINRGLTPQNFSPLSRQEFEGEIQEHTVYGPDTYLASSSVRKISTDWNR